MSNGRRDDDLEWLYRREEESSEQTRVLPADEVAALQGAPRSGRGRPARPTQSAPPPPPPPRQPERTRGRDDGVPPPNRRRKRRHPLRRIVLVLALAWVVFMVGTPVFALVRGTVVDAAPSGDRPAEQPGRTILLVGSDAREDMTPEERSKLRTGSTEGRRTDTMLLLYVPPSGNSALVSLPRDSLVSIPGHGKNKLNAAYSFGGAPLLVETVEQNTGVRVDGYLEIGFLGLVDMVDAVGGIEVCPTKPMKDKDAHIDIAAGCQNLDGVTALGYVRMRKADPRGDLGRIERQREVIGKVMKKAVSPLSILNPITYWKLNMAVSRSVARSDETGPAALASIVSGLFQSATGAGLSLTVPIGNANYNSSVGSAVLWDEKASREMFTAIATGDVKALEKFQG
ncbi:LCP family protein [Tessaracoccus antarcticus]|uniref:LytR family transcriptional regulator n=1 Tax=Tessaracoccus antarcticus TaxID=2479848 RepID=A0A3M0GBA4_9ACTN|nr:LCP family protein [Tessaracoccus antarcticus]RMB62271.1 LytR family transcriptional regulator [Tessaracoccus antarcticus]